MHVSGRGGTRSERRKWIHGFADTSVVLFTLDTTVYAKIFSENSMASKMEEQLRVFDTIINNRWLSRSVFVLIFTKLDLLEEWLQKCPK